MSDSNVNLLKRAAKTQDAKELFKIVEDAVKIIEFLEARNAFSSNQIKKLKDQILRQTEMIDNLNNTLFNK